MRLLRIGELNVDLGFTANVGKAASVLTGINYFNYSNPMTTTTTTLQTLRCKTASLYSKMEY
jgi:hypothetical protein